jgi:hypothetical protein
MKEEMMNDECRMQTSPRRREGAKEDAKKKAAFVFSSSCLPSRLRVFAVNSNLGIRFACLCAAFCILTIALPVRANPSQEDVFKSIQSNVSDPMDGRKVAAFFVAAAAVVILIVVINNRQQRVVKPKIVNHQAKLLRELMKSAGLKSSQVRQLKMLSADLRERGEPVDNLVTLLLCPSLIKRARDDNRPISPR